MTRPATHVLIWRDPTGGANAGAGPISPSKTDAWITGKRASPL
jgi:hypothetical protein